jgi:uncharacterized protein with WD repeat
MRLKRPDTRPNEKERRKLSRKIEDEKSIQDIRTTKRLKVDKKEREVQRLPMKTEESKMLLKEKRIRYLRKKMKKIDSLMTKQKNGETLDQQQLACIDSLDEVLAEMEQFADVHVALPSESSSSTR